VLRSAQEPDDIDWRCPSCGDNGIIYGWRGSDDDLAQSDIWIRSDPADQCTVYLDDDDNQVVQSLLPADREIERVVLGARRTARGIQLTCSGIELENLHGFLAFEANHDPDRRRQARLDRVCASIERALERPTEPTAPTALDP